MTVNKEREFIDVKSEITLDFLMKSFVIANQKINIIPYDELYDGEGNPLYGQFVYEDGEILIAIRKIGSEKLLGKEQILNTLWHEIFHAFSQMYDNSVDEKQAQCYANFMRELEGSKQ